MNKEKNRSYRVFLQGLIGCFILVLGITLILLFWDDVISLFRGAAGIILAIAGLTTLYLTQK